MKITELDNQVSISDQIGPSDVADLAAEGIEIIVCNRPDREADGQPDFAEVSRACKAMGITAAHIPFAGEQVTDAHVGSFLDLLQSGKKVHAYCRSGARSSKLWARARSRQGIASEKLIDLARQAGYDVSQHV